MWFANFRVTSHVSDWIVGRGSEQLTSSLRVWKRPFWGGGPQIRWTQEGCGGLVGENPAAFPKAQSIFQQPFSLPESAQTLAGILLNNYFVLPENRGRIFQQRRNLPENLSSKEFQTATAFSSFLNKGKIFGSKTPKQPKCLSIGIST